MLYQGIDTIEVLLDEMLVSYNRLLDVSIVGVDDGILLLLVGGKNFKLDERFKSRTVKGKVVSIYNICSMYKRQLISREEAIDIIHKKVETI